MNVWTYFQKTLGQLFTKIDSISVLASSFIYLASKPVSPFFKEFPSGCSKLRFQDLPEQLPPIFCRLAVLQYVDLSIYEDHKSWRIRIQQPPKQVHYSVY